MRMRPWPRMTTKRRCLPRFRTRRWSIHGRPPEVGWGPSPESAQAFVPPSGTSAHRDQVGPPAWLLGVAGILLILGVAAAALVFVVRPLASDRIESVAGDAMAAALSQTSVAPELGSGTVVVSEQQINRSIRTHGPTTSRSKGCASRSGAPESRRHSRSTACPRP